MGTDVEMAKDEWALHETLELHELLAFKNVCMTKSVTMPVLVSDESLKGAYGCVCNHGPPSYRRPAGASVENGSG
ncbi:hypothetical protein [Alicyclobacillus mengziensis]|uniref:hypothetical protein n=1 Tax=Alicyclobacillus mengziensis TaxID=2931921 RepID=UPI0020116A99|nr:hypothetical protein [Alicyclobacillus mengziensis]